MQISRRTLLMGGAALLGAQAMPRRALAQASATLGAMRIEMLSDGNLVLPRDFILGPMPEPEAEAILTAHHVPAGPLTPPCNLTLLRHEDRVVLFDIGSGPDFQPTAGLLPETLDAVGLAPEDITHLVITHGHPDHIWGMLDDFGDPWFRAPLKQLLDAFITELEARLASEGDQAIGEKTTTEWLDWAKDRAAELDPLAEGLAGLFRNVQRP